MMPTWRKGSILLSVAEYPKATTTFPVACGSYHGLVLHSTLADGSPLPDVCGLGFGIPCKRKYNSSWNGAGEEGPEEFMAEELQQPVFHPSILSFVLNLDSGILVLQHPCRSFLKTLTLSIPHSRPRERSPISLPCPSPGHIQKGKEGWELLF